MQQQDRSKGAKQTITLEPGDELHVNGLTFKVESSASVRVENVNADSVPNATDEGRG